MKIVGLRRPENFCWNGTFA